VVKATASAIGGKSAKLKAAIAPKNRCSRIFEQVVVPEAPVETPVAAFVPAPARLASDSGRLAAVTTPIRFARGGQTQAERTAGYERTEDIRPVALVDDCVAGMSGAWDAFVRRYAPLILAIARRSLRARGMSPAPDDLEDICENTFLALVKDDFSLLRSYNDKFALSTFLGVIARTQAGRFARRRRAGGSDVDVAELPSRMDDPAVAVEEGDLRAALRDTLAEMPERDRQILHLFYYSDRDYRAIAQELKISANSVGAALHRARERLKARLEARDKRSASGRLTL
jgi:RNA polymerase sigma factor (sigma-70 family)